MADIRFTVSDQRLHGIDVKMFGNFLERPSWGGEIGVEGALIPGTHQLQPEVLHRLKDMEIPILRFPGGSDVDYVDWTDMIDNVPGRPPGDRPVSTPRGNEVTNNFGYDEYLRLCEELQIETHLVVNFADAFIKRKPLAEAALHAASLVAYCNTPVDTPLPDGMTDWPAVRAKNGHAAPYGVKYWQIGNENWFFVNMLQAQGWDHDEIDRWYLECLVAYVDTMQAVDPSIQILVDVQFKRVSLMESIRAILGSKVHYFVEHVYTPWAISHVLKDGQNYPIKALTDEEVWLAWVTVPDLNGQGQSVFYSNILDQARRLGYKLGITEWNWNGWWSIDYTPGMQWPPDFDLARGLGAAGYVHAFMRAGDTVEIGSQSMTVGNRWGITGIRADRDAETPAYFLPTGQMILFYASHHGDRLLPVQGENIPTFRQPFQMGGLKPAEKVAYVDAVATVDEKAVYFHAINRHFRADLPIIIDLSAFSGLAAKATHYQFEGRLHNAPAPGEPDEVGWFSEQETQLEGSLLRVTLAKRSISCLLIPRSELPAYSVEYLAHNTPTVAVAEETSPVQMTVRNTSARTWSAGGHHPVRLGYRWHTSDGHELPASLWDDHRTELPHDLAPGDSITLNATLGMPRASGDYELRWDMVEELVTWFAWQGVPTLNVPVRVNEEIVERPRPDDMRARASHHNRQTGIDNLQQALDNDPTTRWSSQTPQQPGMWFEVDLGSARTIGHLRLNNDHSPRDYPRGYVVKLSLDGQSWQTAAEDPTNKRALDVTFSPRQARYIRIEQTGSDPEYWWSIHRIDISDEVTLSARASHNNSLTGPDNVSQALDGRPDTRWSSQAPQQHGMWFEIDLNVSRLVSGLTLDTSGSPNDYPRGYRIYLATDRNQWTEVARNDRNTGPVNVNFNPRPVRFIYIEQTGSSDTWWWSIHQVVIRSTEFSQNLSASASHNNVLSGDDNISRALDNDPTTRWSSQIAQHPGMWFEIDLRETRPVSGLALDTAGSPNDYPRGYKILISTDRQQWAEVARNDHNDQALDTDFSPRSTRYIRIEQTGASEAWWWSIHGITIKT